ncbi:hypothetical protein [Aquibacillus salsiterrae]|uniref:Uncharacterized protein n=1 Tax=Aquibacillus salsiterrae TaxID=2950439 RepID=A0A9X3WEG0_9BACI|nr:hypothetical protein [Aquibacillus salsiterrae]MDC3418340.1 hypothetical protein [Aquibacillus salsiterrae]
MNMREDILPFAQAIYSTISKSALRVLARETKFVQRKGKLKPEDFLVLCSLLEDSVSDDSLQELCGTLSHQSNTSLSKQALDNRFNEKAIAFLKEIFFRETVPGTIDGQLSTCSTWYRI